MNGQVQTWGRDCTKAAKCKLNLKQSGMKFQALCPIIRSWPLCLMTNDEGAPYLHHPLVLAFFESRMKVMLPTQDDETAVSSYQLLATDLKADKAWRQYASVQVRSPSPPSSPTVTCPPSLLYPNQ